MSISYPPDKVAIVHPKNPVLPPGHAYLSILDSSVANYLTCGAIFHFPYLSTSSSSRGSRPVLFGSCQCFSNPPPPAYDQEALINSLAHTLDIYPEYAGTLRLVKYNPSAARTDHRRRFGRVELLWAREDDPGVQLTFRLRDQDSISSIQLPPAGAQGDRVRDAKGVQRDLFVPSSSIVRLRDADDSANRLSAIGVRVTYFSDGIVIGVGMHHSLGDATTLLRFVKDWTAIHRALLSNSSLPALERPFDPSLLDRYASGDVDAPSEDPEVRVRAMEIPQLRYDFWASNEGRPPIITSPGRPDPLIAAADEAEGSQRGPPIPWHTWHWEAPVVDYLLEFTPADIQGVYGVVCPPGTSKSISRLDALLGHLWRLITRARQVPPTEHVYLNTSLGLRARLSPPLSPDFLGCPLTNISSALPSSGLLSSALDGAKSIRDAIELATPRLPDLLHHEAHVLDPIREWNSFMGSRHLMVTSWLSLEADEVYWDEEARGTGWMHADMWPVDGLMVLMDRSSSPIQIPAPDKEAEAEDKKKGRRWYDDGVVVRLVLQTEVLEWLLADDELWPSPQAV